MYSLFMRSYTLSTALLLSFLWSLMLLLLHKASALHASEFLSQGPWWNHQSYSALCLMQVWDLPTQLCPASPWTYRRWPNVHLTPCPSVPCLYSFEHQCPVQCYEKRHNDITAVSQQVSVAVSSWAGVLGSWQVLEPFHVTTAVTFTFALSALSEHILILLSLYLKHICHFACCWCITNYMQVT